MTATASPEHSIQAGDQEAVEAVEAVQRSYGGCCSSPQFFDDFYDKFVAKSPKIAEKFGKTNFDKQKELLRSSITYMILYYTGSPMAQSKIDDLGESHSRTRLDIAPEMYSFWIDSLLETVRMHDKEYSPTLERQWRAVLSKGMSQMKAMYLSGK